MRIAIDVGHYKHTKGKQTPNGLKEFYLNQRVAIAFNERLLDYKDVLTKYVSDITGNTDVSLTNRSKGATDFKADILVSIHHNAFQGKWGNHGGTETFIYKGTQSEALGKTLNDAIVSTLGLRNRGVKDGNMAVSRNFKGKSALVEIGFMDSNTDHNIIVDENNSRLVGIAMADAVAKLYKLVLKQKEQSNSLVGTKFTYKKGTVIYNNNPKPTAYPKQPTRNHEALVVQETGEWLKIRIAVLNPTDVWIYKKDLNGPVAKPPVTKKIRSRL